MSDYDKMGYTTAAYLLSSQIQSKLMANVAYYGVVFVGEIISNVLEKTGHTGIASYFGTTSANSQLTVEYGNTWYDDTAEVIVQSATDFAYAISSSSTSMLNLSQTNNDFAASVAAIVSSAGGANSDKWSMAASLLSSKSSNKGYLQTGGNEYTLTTATSKADTLMPMFGFGSWIIKAGAGDDYILGKYISSNSTTSNCGVYAYGESGNDFIDTVLDGYGGDGDDYVISSNRAYGEAGNDRLIGNRYADGGSGNDYIVATTNDDTLIGGTGDDYLSGLDGRDSMSGGDGDDTIEGGAGNDTIDGGNGTDTLVATADTNFTLTNSTLTGQGTDSISNIEAVILTGGSGSNGVDASGSSLSVSLYGMAGNDTLRGGSGDDLLAGGAGTNVIDGGAGTDIIQASTSSYMILGASMLFNSSETTTFSNIEAAYLTGSSGSNSIANWGFQGSTVVDGLGGDDTLAGGSYSDQISGGDGNDSLYGDGGDDILKGGVGNDALYGGAGNDALYGGAGNDTYCFDADTNLGSDTLTETGDGTDTLDFSATTSQGITIDLGSGTAQQVNSNLTLTLGISVSSSNWLMAIFEGMFTGYENVVGTNNADTITGSLLNNNFSGGDGNDVLSGGDGNDTLDGGTGNDKLYGGNSDDSLIGGSGDDVLSGDAGIDSLLGGDGNDYLLGGDNSDTLTGGAGTDTLVGGSGADKFFFSPQAGIDIIKDFNASEGDRIQINASAFGLSTSIFKLSSSLSKCKFDSNTKVLSINGTQVATLEGVNSFSASNSIQFV